MMQSGISSSDKTTKSAETGSRCTVCIGCGRCGIRRSMRILTSAALQRPCPDLTNNFGLRLAAADIGTTTIAMELYDARGGKAADFACVNPQTVYGADVLSRIRAAEDEQARTEMRRMVWEVLDRGLDAFMQRLPSGERLVLCIAANTTMSYLLLGHDPAELGHAPFTASFLDGACGEHQRADGTVPYYVLPGMSAFVGGDLTAGVLACGMTESTSDLTLLIDLGTNGELVLGNADGLLATAAAAGPAFEGGPNRGIWGADMVRILAELRRRGLCDETGLLAEPYFDTGIRISDVVVTQAQIRAVQLAKGAIRAGITILLREYAGEHGLTEEAAAECVGRVVLAGGFGCYLDAADAALIGLLPEELRGKTRTGGNTALAGAALAGERFLKKLCSADAGDGTEPLPHPADWKVRVLNLAEHPEFEELYLENMGL